jgi:hypothetical protein
VLLTTAPGTAIGGAAIMSAAKAFANLLKKFDEDKRPRLRVSLLKLD